MSGYWQGLLTLPMIAGALAAAYGLYRAFGWLIDRGAIHLIRAAGNPAKAAQFAGIAAATKRTIIMPLTRLFSVTLSFGAVDGQLAERVRQVVYEEIRPPLKTIGLKHPKS